MTTSNQHQISRKRPQASKIIPQAKGAIKTQPAGLSREEIRQIVIEMIG